MFNYASQINDLCDQIETVFFDTSAKVGDEQAVTRPFVRDWV